MTRLHAVFPLGKKEHKAVQVSAEGAKSAMGADLLLLYVKYQTACGK